MIWKLFVIVFLLGQCIEIQAIIGGQVAEAPIPWQVLILIYNKQFCGGTILDSKTILTAAHCFEDSSPEKTFVLKRFYVSLVVGSTSKRIWHKVMIEKVLTNPWQDYGHD